MKKRISVLIITLWFLTVLISAIWFFKKDKIVNYKEVTVLELWHIDMVEGGQNSRAKYLDGVAKIFEKENQSVFISVTTQTVTSVQENFSKGIYPDMISYSTGLEGLLPLIDCIDIDCIGYGGYYQNKVYAYPWAIGGYVYIVREGVTNPSNIYASKGQFNLPLLACYLDGYDVTKVTELSPETAYYEFLSDKNTALIGTQRDLYRLKNKNLSIKVTPLESYTDVLQYISIFKVSKNRQNLCKLFLETLSKNAPETIYKIGMLFPQDETKIADNGPIDRLLTVNYRYTLPFYYGLGDLNEIESLLKNEKINGDNKMKFLKNTLIYLK